MWQEITSIYRRAVSTMRLDPAALAEIQANPSSTYQAAIVAFIASLSFAVHVRGGWQSTLYVSLVGMALWIALAYLVYLLGTTVFRTKDTPPTTFAPFARGIGFAMAPGVLLIFLFFEPFELGSFSVGKLMQYASMVWRFAAMTAVARIALGGIAHSRATLLIGVAMFPVFVLEYILLR